MTGTLLFAALIAAAPARHGCADHWTVALDPQSFAHNGADRTFTKAELAAFRTKLQAALRVAAGDACRGRGLASAKAAGIRRVDVHAASGATEPQFYAGGKGRLNFEWVFAEEGLAIPPRADMVGGLICWADPAEKMCTDAGD